MVTTFVTLFTALLVFSATAAPAPSPKGPENVTEIIQEIITIFDEDDFSKVTTKGSEPEPEASERTKRSLSSCGAAPAQRTTFVRCFTPSTVSVQRRNFVRNYVRQGNYGQCLNYYRALPLTNVAPVASGYTGQLNTNTGRTYTVNACQRCYGGNSGISVQSTFSPSRGLVRNFIFRPQINNINYNTYVTSDSGYNNGGGYSNGADTGVGYVADAGYGNGAGYGYGGNTGGYVSGGSYGYSNGGSSGYSSGSYGNGDGYSSGYPSNVVYGAAPSNVVYSSGAAQTGNGYYSTGTGYGNVGGGGGYGGIVGGQAGYGGGYGGGYGDNVVNIGGSGYTGGAGSQGVGSGVLTGAGRVGGGAVGTILVPVSNGGSSFGSSGGHGCTVNCN